MTSSQMTGPRYAIYFAPAVDHPLWNFGSAVLGYDAASGSEVAGFDPRLVTKDVWRAWTEEPRRYGFHATIKAPFRLAADAREESLFGTMTAVAARHRAFPLDLQVTSLGPFVALTPTEAPAALAALEADTVQAFEPFRAPLSEAEYRRRRPERLTATQRERLDRFGYPYVGSEFRFHMTLTGALPSEWQSRVAAMLDDAHRALPATPRVKLDRLCLFRQDAPERPFHMLDAALLRARC